ncbi:MAG: O-antigen ligase family protein [Candidatus Rokuibacteriota bacterium]
MILFYLLVTVLPLTQHPIWSLFVGDLTIIKYLGIVCVIYAAADFVTQPHRIDFLRTWQARLFLCFSGLVTLSFLALTKPVALEMSPLMTCLSLVMLFFTTLVLVNSVSRLRWTLLATIGGLAFASLYVLREFQKYYSPGNPIRPGYVVGDPNYFTLSALLCIPLAFSLMQERRPRWLRPFAATCLVLMILAVTVAASRGGFLGLMVAVVFVLWRSKQRARNFAVLACLIVPLSIVAPVSPLARLLRPTYSDAEARDSRFALWNAGLRMIQAHWLTGVGVGNFKALSAAYQEPGNAVKAIAHNTYIQLTAELGIVGLSTYLAVLIATFASLEKTRIEALRLRSSFLYHSAAGTQGGLIGYAVAAFFVSAAYQRLFWFVIFVSIALSTLTRQVARRLARAAAQRQREQAAEASLADGGS